MTPTSTRYVNYNGVRTPVYSYGGSSGYSFYWNQPMWYYRTPFHPAYYFTPPVHYNGAVYPGSFSFFRFFWGLVWFVALIAVGVYLYRRYTASRLTSGTTPTATG